MLTTLIHRWTHHPCPGISAPRRGMFCAILSVVTIALMALGGGRWAHAQGLPALSEPQSDWVPPEVRNVDIIERLDNPLPLDLTFTDDNGHAVSLRELFDGRRPVVLQLGYYKCPMLCNLVLNELVKGMKDLDWSPGDQFTVVSVSVNPLENAELAALKKQNYLLEYERAGTASGWHFLTGPAENSQAVADAVGFGFQFVPETGEYAHAAVIILCTPDGRVSRYLYGVKFDPGTLKLGLLEASEGRIGTTLERFILWCHVYDPQARGYVVFALRIMKLGGALTLVLVAGAIGLLWLRDLRRRRTEPVSPAARSHSSEGCP